MDFEWLISERQNLKEILTAALTGPFVQDVAFIGNASDLYEWKPAAIVDFDACLIVKQLDHPLGEWLMELRTNLTSAMLVRGIAFELRLIRGAYKLELPKGLRASFVLHLSVFTEDGYRQRPELLRWGWRKYKCLIDSDRFSRLAPECPSTQELLHGRGGVLQKLMTIQAGIAPFVELLLPDLSETRWSTVRGEPLFTEYCLSAVAGTARNHARVSGCAEADYLPNQQFSLWYVERLFFSSALLDTMELKSAIRQKGEYAHVAAAAQELALGYLSSLSAHLGLSEFK